MHYPRKPPRDWIEWTLEVEPAAAHQAEYSAASGGLDSMRVRLTPFLGIG